jgi:SPP1 family predicted phage head-tail adaptor
MQQLEESAGTSRFPVETWTPLTGAAAGGVAGGMFASKIDIRGAERFQADQLSARYDIRWEINYRSDMDPDAVNVPKTRRLVYKGRIYDIVTASMIGRNEGVELMTLASP